MRRLCLLLLCCHCYTLLCFAANSRPISIEVPGLEAVELHDPINITIRTNQTFLLNKAIVLKIHEVEWLTYGLASGLKETHGKNNIRVAETDLSTYAIIQIDTDETMQEKLLSIFYVESLFNRTLLFEKRILLIAPPEKPTITIRPTAAQLKEGDEIQVRCYSKFLGLPPRRLHIEFADAEPIDPDYILNEMPNDKPEMMRRYKLTWKSDNSSVQCRVGNEEFQEIMLSVAYAPREMNFLLMDGGDSNKLEDQEKRLTQLQPGSSVNCIALGNPNPVITWRKNTRPYTKDGQAIYHMDDFDEAVDLMGNVLHVKANISHILKKYGDDSELRFVAICTATNKVTQTALVREYAFIVRDAVQTVSATMSIYIVCTLAVLICLLCFISICLCIRSRQGRNKEPFQQIDRTYNDEGSPVKLHEYTSLQSKDPNFQWESNSTNSKLGKSMVSNRSATSSPQVRFAETKSKNPYYNDLGDPIPTEV